MIYLYVLIALLVGFILGFVVVALKITVKPSGVLHITKTQEKEYYTIEIDDLEELSGKKTVLLLVKTSRDMHSL